MSEEFVFIFADVVRYSTMTNSEQKDVITRLTDEVQSLHPVSSLKTNPALGFFLPTGDGFAAAFAEPDLLTHPEAILAFAESVHRVLHGRAALRIGIHRGTARAYQDFNSRFLKIPANNNLAGTDLNWTQRLMSLADPGETVVSDRFYQSYEAERGDDEARQHLKPLGSVRIKHGKELALYRVGADQAELPSRVRAYLTAQREMQRAIQDIHRKVQYAAAYRQPRGLLQTRCSLFLYDSRRKCLALSKFRFGTDVEREPFVPVEFDLTEGPGRVFAEASSSKRFQSGYYELPIPSEGNRARWNEEAANTLRVPIEKVREFRRPAAAYYYLTLHMGGSGHEPFGLISVDLMRPLVARTELLGRLRADRRIRKKDVDRIASARVAKKLSRLENRLTPFMHQLSTAYAVVSNY